MSRRSQRLTNLRQIYIRGNDGITNLEWLATIERLRSDIKLPSVVDIPDTNLDTAVRTALSVTGTLPMSEEMLEELETLMASNRNIADLTGCEHMTDLTSLGPAEQSDNGCHAAIKVVFA